MTRDELIETMARAMLESFKARIAVSAGKPFAETGVSEPSIDVFARYALAGLAAIEAAGLAIVPVEATDEMLSALMTRSRHP